MLLFFILKKTFLAHWGEEMRRISTFFINANILNTQRVFRAQNRLVLTHFYYYFQK